ncbi:MAG TPA: preprotein translocase subunit Sec61beta [archaeon]|nr:preprotein translocase subunit Sec61beta [archaeon]
MNPVARESGPSSSIGIMRFFDTDSGGPKISPEFVIAIAIVFTLVISILHVFK